LESQQKLQELNAATTKERSLGYAANRNDAHYCDQKLDVEQSSCREITGLAQYNQSAGRWC